MDYLAEEIEMLGSEYLRIKNDQVQPDTAQDMTEDTGAAADVIGDVTFPVEFAYQEVTHMVVLVGDQDMDGMSAAHIPLVCFRSRCCLASRPLQHLLFAL